MLDLLLRPIKEDLLRPFCVFIPSFVTPTHMTMLAFGFGLLSCFLAAFYEHRQFALLMWVLNRLLDSLDGSVARYRGTVSERGAFLDLLCDFIVYSLIPISVTYGNSRQNPTDWMIIALLEASFHINNFVLLYVAAISNEIRDQLTSLVMRPALVEGFESGILFTLMLAFPSYTRIFASTMTAAVSVGIWERVVYLMAELGRIDESRRESN